MLTRPWASDTRGKWITWGSYLIMRCLSARRHIAQSGMNMTGKSEGHCEGRRPARIRLSLLAGSIIKDKNRIGTNIKNKAFPLQSISPLLIRGHVLPHGDFLGVPQPSSQTARARLSHGRLVTRTKEPVDQNRTRQSALAHGELTSFNTTSFCAPRSSRRASCETPAPSPPTSVVSKTWRHAKAGFHALHASPFVNQALDHGRGTLLSEAGASTVSRARRAGRVNAPPLRPLLKTPQYTAATRVISSLRDNPISPAPIPRRGDRCRVRARPLRIWESLAFPARVSSSASLGNASRLTGPCTPPSYAGVQDLNARMAMTLNS